MKLSQRLLALTEYINIDDQIIDIGSDHGYLPFYLLKNNLVKKADASDISKIACQNLSKRFQNYLSTKKTKIFNLPGISQIDLSPYNVIVISGLGAKKIVEILEEKEIKQNLILQPTNNFFYLRKQIAKWGYRIEDEKIIHENDIDNLIIYAVKSEKQQSYQEKDLFLGPILQKKAKESSIKNYYQKLYLQNKNLFEKSNNPKFEKQLKYLKTSLNINFSLL